ncbi:MAG: hypothetical protein HY901_38125 [Deltaproteobacteria bacterium]|nr:hypothetical protein [Deltaproteobacteria bacterium]
MRFKCDGNTLSICEARTNLDFYGTPEHYWVSSSCGDKQCVSSGIHAACVVTPLQQCSGESSTCAADQETVYACNSDVGYYEDRGTCRGYPDDPNTKCHQYTEQGVSRAACVNPAMIPCTAVGTYYGCTSDKRSLERCTFAGYASTWECGSAEVCVDDGDFHGCALATLTKCDDSVPLHCSDDGRFLLECETTGEIGYIHALLDCGSTNQKCSGNASTGFTCSR